MTDVARALQAAEKVVGSRDWQAEPPAPPQKINQLQGGGTGAFACRASFSAASFACGFFSVDFSICPLFVGAGKTQSEVAFSLRASIKRNARSPSGIVLRAFS